jgi:hypothetical protein
VAERGGKVVPVKEKGCATMSMWRSVAEREGEGVCDRGNVAEHGGAWRRSLLHEGGVARDRGNVAERGGAWRGSLPHEGARPRRGGVKGSVVLHLDGIMKKTFAERKRVLYGAIFPQK